MVKEARRLWTLVGRRIRALGGLLLVSIGALLAGAGALIGVRRWLGNNRTPTETRPPIAPPAGIHPSPPDAYPTLAVIGDFGRCQKPGVECLNERVVAHLVDSWSPDYVITTGDNNYPDGERSTLIANLDPFRRYIEDGRFLPVLGNHDWKCRDAPLPYTEQFRPPGNGRYYCVVLGELAVWALDSDEQEPDGIDAGSAQAAWLRAGLAQSRSRLNLVFLHHPPYSSGHHGSSATLRWPFAAWGADAVFSGHEHSYERLEIDGIPYFVNGSGGSRLRGFGRPLPGSRLRDAANYGAQRIMLTDETATVEFWSTKGQCLDSVQLCLRPAAKAVVGAA